MATVMHVDHLPHWTEASVVTSELFDAQSMENVKEVYNHADGGTSAWVVFNTHKDAERAIKRYDGYKFGSTGQKMSTETSCLMSSESGFSHSISSCPSSSAAIDTPSWIIPNPI